MGLAGSDRGVRQLILPVADSKRVIAELNKALKGKGRLVHNSERWKGLKKQLTEYFKQRRKVFIAKVDLGDLAPFSRKALKIAMTIPYGQVRSYWWVAARMGEPGAFTAVGQAMAKNPVPIVIPCHRVIRHDSTIGGYSSGIKLKLKLLKLEGIEVEKDKQSYIIK